MTGRLLPLASSEGVSKKPVPSQEFLAQPALDPPPSVTTGSVSTAADVSLGGGPQANVVLDGIDYVATGYSVNELDLSDEFAESNLVGPYGIRSYDCSSEDANNRLTFVSSITTDGTDLFVADSCGLHKIIPSTGAMSLVYNTASSTTLQSVTADPSGTLYATAGSTVIQIDPSAGTSSLIATLASGELGYGLAADGDFIYVVARTSSASRLVKIDLSDDFHQHSGERTPRWAPATCS